MPDFTIEDRASRITVANYNSEKAGIPNVLFITKEAEGLWDDAWSNPDTFPATLMWNGSLFDIHPAMNEGGVVEHVCLYHPGWVDTNKKYKDELYAQGLWSEGMPKLDDEPYLGS